jgi:secreted protein with Ig-like and vWFA domain
MSNEDPSTRPILPQQSQMNSFSFAPQQYTQRETQKNYVFVDEHNRHKRLKGMLY